MIKNLISGFSLLIGSFAIILVTSSTVHAQFNPVETPCEGITDAGVCQDGRKDEDPINGENGVIIAAANLLAVVGGIIAVIIIVISGMKMITSGGDGSSVKNNRNAIIYAVVGVIVIVLARAIVEVIVLRIRRS